MPFASMSNVTSTCGMPRGAGGMPTSWNLPSVLLYAAISDSPWSTWISTEGWLSSAVVKISDLRVGIVVLRSISFVNTPPFVSMPSESGVTSSRRTSLTSPRRTPRLDGGADGDDLVGVDALVRLLADQLLDLSWTAGMRVMPPTRTTWSICRASRPASASACFVGPTVRSSRSCGQLARASPASAAGRGASGPPASR